MEEFGKKLKRVREKQNISLEEISLQTSINLQYLKDIEDGNFVNLPQTYRNLFMKTYAKTLGIRYPFDTTYHKGNTNFINESSLFDDIDDIEDKKNSSTDDFDEIDEDANNELFHKKIGEFIKKYRNLLIMAFLVLVSTVVILILTNFFGDDTVKQAEKQTIQVITVEGSGANLSIKDSIKIETDTLTDSLHFTVTATDSCYIVYYTDKSMIHEKMLIKGNTILLKALNLIEMKVGNLSVLNIFFNKRDYTEEFASEKNKTGIYLRVSPKAGPQIIKKSHRIISYIKQNYGK